MSLLPLLQLALIVGGTTGTKYVRVELRKAGAEQSELATNVDSRPGRKAGSKQARVAVDAVFLQRLGIILRV